MVGQGTLGGALVSQAVLDEGVMENFKPGEEGQLWYGDIPLNPIMFQDDLANSVETIDDARKTNEKVKTLTNERGLKLNEDKSVYLIYGSN